MNILHLVTTPWWNASAYYAVTTAISLRNRGHRILVAGSRGTPALEKASQSGLEVYSDLHLESFNPYHVFRNIFRLKKLIQDHRIDLVHAHQPQAHLFGALATKNGKNILPLVRSVSDVRPPANNIINKRLHLQYTDGFIFSCQTSLERYQKRFDFTNKVTERILAGIDLDQFVKPVQRTDYRKQLGIPTGYKLIGVIARLSPEKGLFHFLTASKYVLEKENKVMFLISGEKVQISHAELKSFAHQLGLKENFVLLDRVDPVQDLIQAIDIGVVSSVSSEVVCRIATEFMAYGKPVIATDINVLPEMIQDGENGFIVSRNDPRGMGESILKMIGDEFLSSRIRQNNINKIKNDFNLDIFSIKTEQVYQKAMADFQQRESPKRN